MIQELTSNFGLRHIRDGINGRLQGHFNYYGVIGNS